ncbi:2-oxoglutarate:acceptor oxidoreductase, partial [Campylobacter jejuni]
MKYQLRFGGEGGQGVITAGEILAEAAIKEG